MGRYTFFAHQRPTARWGYYIEQRLSDIKKEIEDLQVEKESLEWLRTAIRVCPDCNGGGRVRVVVDVDESEYYTCDGCKGTGVTGGNVAIPTTAPGA